MTRWQRFKLYVAIRGFLLWWRILELWGKVRYYL